MTNLIFFLSKLFFDNCIQSTIYGWIWYKFGSTALIIFSPSETRFPISDDITRVLDNISTQVVPLTSFQLIAQKIPTCCVLVSLSILTAKLNWVNICSSEAKVHKGITPKVLSSFFSEYPKAPKLNGTKLEKSLLLFWLFGKKSFFSLKSLFKWPLCFLAISWKATFS